MNFIQTVFTCRGFDGAGPVQLDEDLLLPCEFCDDLFPQDVLVMHQVHVLVNSVCWCC